MLSVVVTPAGRDVRTSMTAATPTGGGMTSAEVETAIGVEQRTTLAAVAILTGNEVTLNKLVHFWLFPKLPPDHLLVVVIPLLRL